MPEDKINAQTNAQTMDLARLGLSSLLGSRSLIRQLLPHAGVELPLLGQLSLRGSGGCGEKQRWRLRERAQGSAISSRM